MVSEGECDDEEGNSEYNGHTCDDVDKVFDLPCDRSHSRVESRCEMSDATHYRVVARVDHLIGLSHLLD